MKYAKQPPPTPLALAVLLLMGGGVAKAESQWAGGYYGLGIGSTQTRPGSSPSYGKSGTTPAAGWDNNQFKGAVYNSVNSMQALDDGPDMGQSPTNSAMPALDTWAGSSSFSQSKPTGVAMLGFSRQSGNLVWGGELRSTFGNFGAEQTSSLSMSGTKSGSFSDGEGAQVTFTSYDGALTSPATSPIQGWYEIEYSANYSQTSTHTQQIKMSTINAAVARLGYSLGNTLVYAVGGVAQSSVKASSRTSVTESVSGSVDSVPMSGTPATAPITGTKTYTLSGEQSKNAVGFAIGAGAEWLVGKDLSLRAEGTYYNLGSVRVNASTADGAISYSTNQAVRAYSAFVALTKKF